MHLQVQLPVNPLNRSHHITMAPQALKGANSHAGIPTPQPVRTNTSNVLDIVIALRPVVTYHGRDRLECQPTVQLPRV